MTAPRRRPTVALVTDAIAPYHHGGKEQRTFHIAGHLTAWADVDIYTMKWWPEPGRTHALGSGVTAHAIAPKRPLYNGERRSITQALIFAVCCLQLLWKRFDRIEVDSIPVFPLFTAKLVAAVRRTELVSTWHEVWGEDYWRTYLGPIGGRLAAWLERTAIGLADHVVAASPHTADRLQPYLRPGQRLSVSRSGVDLDLVQASNAVGDQVDVSAVGRMLEHKRFDLLLDAVALLRERGQDCSVALIGTGPEHDRLVAQAERLGIADLVQFRQDVVTPVDLYGALKMSRVFVSTSEREGFGIAVLEAMACGLPVVTTSAPDNAAQHLVSESGLGLVCEPTADAVASSIATLVERQTPTHTGYADEWIDAFGWRSVAADMAVVLRCA